MPIARKVLSKVIINKNSHAESELVINTFYINSYVSRANLAIFRLIEGRVETVNLLYRVHFHRLFYIEGKDR